MTTTTIPEVGFAPPGKEIMDGWELVPYLFTKLDWILLWIFLMSFLLPYWQNLILTRDPEDR